MEVELGVTGFEMAGELDDGLGSASTVLAEFFFVLFVFGARFLLVVLSGGGGWLLFGLPFGLLFGLLFGLTFGTIF